MKVKVVSDSFQPHRLYTPRNPPGQNTGVGSLSLLQGDLPNPGIKPRPSALQDVWQGLAQYCKAIIFQLNINKYFVRCKEMVL